MFARWREELARVGELVAGIDADSLVGDEPAVLLEQVAGLEKRLGCLRGQLARRAARGEPWKRTGHGSAREWLARVTGSSNTAAERTLEVARRVEGLPVVGEAFRRGRLSEAQAAEVARAARVAPECQAELVRTATSESLGRLREEADRVVAARTDASARYRRQVAKRRLGIYTDRDGLGHLDLALPPDRFASAKAVVDAEGDRVFAAAREAGRREDPGAYGADAMFNIICRQTPGAVHPDPEGERPEEASFQPPAAAPVSAPDVEPGVDGAGEACADGRVPKKLKAAAEIIFVVDLAAFRRGHALSGETVEIRNVGPVPVEVVAEWLDDAFVKTVIRDGTHIPLVHHHGRHVPAHLKTALVVRDPTCQVPGCNRRLRLEKDHHRPHAQGGPVSEANLRRVCKPLHHDQISRDGYRLEGPPGRRRWLDPHGTCLARDPDPPPEPPGAATLAPQLPPELRPDPHPPDQLPLE